MKRWMIYLLVIPVVIYLIILIFAFMKQEDLIFFPEKLPQDYRFTFDQPFEERFFETAPDATIHGLHFKVPQPKGVIFYWHGNAGSLASWGFVAEAFTARGFDILIIDYRTYGKSTGVLSEQALYDDAVFIYRELLKEYSEDQIIVYGRSLGTGIATYLAAQFQPNKLLLETPFESFTKLASHLFPYLPVKLLLQYPLQSDEHIKKVTCPIFMIHGTADEIIPLESAQNLAKIYGKQEALTSVPGGHHNDLLNFPAFQQWLDEALK